MALGPDHIPAGAVRKIDAHEFERQAEDHYVEPLWVDQALFKAETFVGTIHDPCCGFGRIPFAAFSAGYAGRVTGSDIVQRGQFAPLTIEDFLAGEAGLDPRSLVRTRDNIVMNPPFDLGREFIEKAVHVTERKVAAIYPTRRLNAASWMRGLGLVQVWYLTPRPSMPPGHVALEYLTKGRDPSRGKQDFCWLVFDCRAYRHGGGGRSEVGWLHRDKGAI